MKPKPHIEDYIQDWEIEDAVRRINDGAQVALIDAKPAVITNWDKDTMILTVVDGEGRIRELSIDFVITQFVKLYGMKPVNGMMTLVQIF